MPGQIAQRTKNARYRRAMTLQQRIAFELAQEENRTGIQIVSRRTICRPFRAGRAGCGYRVILKELAPVGEFITRRITGSRGYDLLA